jgi:hypothetical protein
VCNSLHAERERALLWTQYRYTKFGNWGKPAAGLECSSESLFIVTFRIQFFTAHLLHPSKLELDEF